MILLDSNVISEVMRPSPDESVTSWLNRQDPSALYLSTVSIAEIRFGLAVLPEGKRKARLSARFQEFVALGFAERLLDFDVEAAEAFGELMAHRRKNGHPMGLADGQIAAIARSRGCALATRNLSDFADCNLELIDPFTEPA